MILAAIATGARQGELLALTWRDVDLATATITIRHTLQVGSRHLAEPKTERSRRSLRMPAMLQAALERHQREQAGERALARRWDARGFVFATRNGGRSIRGT